MNTLSLIATNCLQTVTYFHEGGKDISIIKYNFIHKQSNLRFFNAKSYAILN